jgi:ribosomal protein S18 acetylase RimI-like enzyme
MHGIDGIDCCSSFVLSIILKIMWILSKRLYGEGLEMMDMNDFLIEEYNDKMHRGQVIELWEQTSGSSAAHNVPALAIDKKLAINDGLLFVGMKYGEVIGTVMAGYDGHRGWIYSLAVLPKYRNKGVGSALLSHAEEKLSSLGCMKINLQVREGNDTAEKFYITNGYSTEKIISMGKQLKENIRE